MTLALALTTVIALVPVSLVVWRKWKQWKAEREWKTLLAKYHEQDRVRDARRKEYDALLGRRAQDDLVGERLIDTIRDRWDPPKQKAKR